MCLSQTQQSLVKLLVNDQPLFIFEQIDFKEMSITYKTRHGQYLTKITPNNI